MEMCKNDANFMLGLMAAEIHIFAMRLWTQYDLGLIFYGDLLLIVDAHMKVF